MAAKFQVHVFTLDCMADNYKTEHKEAFEAQRSLTKRHLNKNLQGRSEPVWPLALESAFIDALYNHGVLYDKERRSKGHTRWQNRNRYISNYILESTNKYRTPKQVGSRLQQLGVATKDPHLLRFRQRQDDASGSSALPRHQFKFDEEHHGSTLRHTITVAPHSAKYPSLPPKVILDSPPESIQLGTLMEWRPSTSIIDGMDPTVEVLSPVALVLTSSTLTLLRDDEPLTILTTPLVPDGIRDGRFQYVLRVPPALWQELASRRHDDQSTNWALLHVVFRVNNERLSNVKPFAEVRYDFASSPVSLVEVQSFKPEISSPVKDKSIFRAFEPPISQEFRDTSPPPPSPPRKRNPPRRRASTPKGELNDISVSVPAVTSNKEEEEEKEEEEDTSEQVRYHDQDPQHIFFSSTGHIVDHDSSQCSFESFDLTTDSITHASYRPHDAVYSINGEFLGCYPAPYY